MISKDMTVYRMDGTSYRFDSAAFNTQFKAYAKRETIQIGTLEEQLSAALFVTPSAIHNWRFGSNGPGSLELIRQLAKALSVSDSMLLLKKIVEGNETVKAYTPLQLESAKRVYDAIIDFLEDFYRTDGFTGALWYKFSRSGSKDPESDIYAYAEARLDKVSLILQKEYFFLHDTKLYDELYEYVDQDLLEIFNGKLGFAYRFEAFADGNPTTSEDYSKALKRINEIVEQYT